MHTGLAIPQSPVSSEGMSIMPRDRRGRNRRPANVNHDEDERNKCRAHGVSAAAISSGIAFAIFALTEFAEVTPDGAPLWVTLPIAAIFAGSIWLAFSFGGFVGRDVGTHIIYPTRMGNNRHATVGLLALAAVGVAFMVLGWFTSRLRCGYCPCRKVAGQQTPGSSTRQSGCTIQPHPRVSLIHIKRLVIPLVLLFWDFHVQNGHAKAALEPPSWTLRILETRYAHGDS